MKKTTTRSALLMSVLALLLCSSMLIGTTFAWFTDSVSSTNNIITAGNLDIELYFQNEVNTTWTPVSNTTNIFKNDTLWEPGHTEIVKFKIANEGTLALKYQYALNVVGEIAGVNVNGDPFLLSEHLLFGTTENTITDRENAIQAVEANAVKVSNGIYLNDQDTPLLSGETKEFTMVVYMPETVGNEANYRGEAVPTISLGLNLVATQYVHEEDSFGKDYDEKAWYPAVALLDVLEDYTTEAKELVAGEVTVTVPANSAEGQYKLHVDKLHDKFVGSEITETYDISLYKDEMKVSGVMYPVEIEVGTLLNITKLTHNGNEITNYTYDALTGILSFETDSFSPFAITYTQSSEGAEVENGKIVSGTFAGVNPVTYDETLDDADSEYIAVDYVEDGVTNYVVAKRSETVVVAAGAYTAENGNFTVKEGSSGKLWSIISGLQNNEHSTVYILPGTYNEATTINVYSSMDIIGLGNKEDIKIVKTSSSSSNRHLFNCNGQKADYIEVSISNLTLDATATTTDGKDNAAVQSIRKTKVKCYDLDIIKGTGWDAVAFYVNGNNAVDGVKYPAYMYVEDCSLNTTRTFGVVTTSGTYKFYHTGLTYGGTTYTTNSGSIKNVVMEASDWTW